MREPISGRTTADMVQRLTAEVRRIEGLHQCLSHQTVSTGCAALDRLLPGAGLRRGTLVEWLAPAAGSGAATLALIAAREACRAGGVLGVLDAERSFYPPAAAALGVDLERLLIVRPPRHGDDAWALDQLLRSRAVGAVLAWPGDWDEHTFRRLQLAAESGAGLGFLLRPSSIRHEPSWAELRLLVEPLAMGPLAMGPQAESLSENRRGERDSPILLRGLRKIGTVPGGSRMGSQLPRRGAGRRWQLEILRLRGAKAGAVVAVQLDPQTGALDEMRQADSMRLVPSLAAGAPGRRSRGA